MGGMRTDPETKVTLFTNRLVEGDTKNGGPVTRCAFGVYRATKSARLLDEWVDLINHGGVAALVPTMASDTYLEEVTQVSA